MSTDTDEAPETPPTSTRSSNGTSDGSSTTGAASGRNVRAVGWFGRIGGASYRHRGVVIGAWLIVALFGGLLLGAVGAETRTEFSLPDVESQRGIEILDEHFGGRGAGQNASLVFEADQGVDDPAVRSAMETLFDDVASLDGILRVASPYTPEGETQVAAADASDATVAYAVVEVPSDLPVEDANTLGEEIRHRFPEIDGLDVHLGGQVFVEFEEPTAELVGIAFAVIILIVAFGSVLAMGLPIGVGLAGVGVGTILGGLLSHVMEVPEFAQMIGIMIGLGVGIDYALFIITRFRENRRAGLDVEQSVVTAIDTAGRAVAFAGVTVVISLLGMLIMQLGFINGLAVSAATVVGVTMIASLTLLPALMGVVGDRIEVTRWRGVIASGLVSLALLGVAFSLEPLMLGLPLAIIVLVVGIGFGPLRRELPRRRQRPMSETTAYRWSRLIQRRPWTAAFAGVAVLALLAIPVLDLRLGFADEGNYPTGTDARDAYDLLADGFGAGSNGPLVLTAVLPDGVDLAATAPIADALAATDGIAWVSPTVPNDPDAPTAAMWQVIPTTSPQDAATTELVHDLRDDVLPAATADLGLDVAVTGTVAANIDFSDYLGERMPYFFGAVLALSFLLLMVVFRSVLVPLKAVVMNLLGIGAAYGLMIAGFQWGWLGPVLGIEGGPIEPFMPMMMFAIVFGLSMDYEVFLLSRIKEEWDRTGDSRESVANGLAATARVISAAAAIMVVVFGAFMLGDDRLLRMAGLGLASAVLLDATIVRMLLVPATMELLGDRNWWLPAWLDRILPTVDVEGHAATPVVADVPPHSTRPDGVDRVERIDDHELV